MASGDLPAQVEGVVKEAELRGHCEQVDRALGQAGVHEGGAHLVRVRVRVRVRLRLRLRGLGLGLALALVQG